jgi:drug/metabolite transporter (DMT)-like permease
MSGGGNHLWFVYAFAAAILWGLSYSISGRLMAQHVSPAFMLIVQYIIAFPVYFWLASSTGGLKEGINIFWNNPGLLCLLALSATSIMIGNLMIMSSISMKNATLASLIEICYPLFTLVFAYILFREVHLTIGTAIGALLIFSGIAMIYLKS